jgi:hypothetical protein
MRTGPWLSPNPGRIVRLSARRIWRWPSRKSRTARKIHKALGQQLRYLRRNLSTIEQMAFLGRLKCLGKRLYRLLLVVQELYRQQLWMYENHTHSISYRLSACLGRTFAYRSGQGEKSGGIWCQDVGQLSQRVQFC